MFVTSAHHIYLHINFTIDLEQMSISSNLSEIERYLVIAKQEDVKLARGVKSSAAKLRGALLEIGKVLGMPQGCLRSRQKH